MIKLSSLELRRLSRNIMLVDIGQAMMETYYNSIRPSK